VDGAANNMKQASAPKGALALRINQPVRSLRQGLILSNLVLLAIFDNQRPVWASAPSGSREKLSGGGRGWWYFGVGESQWKAKGMEQPRAVGFHE
jgi:hypothetical protein